MMHKEKVEVDWKILLKPYVGQDERCLPCVFVPVSSRLSSTVRIPLMDISYVAMLQRSRYGQGGLKKKCDDTSQLLFQLIVMIIMLLS